MSTQDQDQLGLHGTFLPNKQLPIHSWYPYLEGFSSFFVENTIANWAPKKFLSLYDPFGGTGTVVTVGVSQGKNSFYSEINPFMRDVIEAKTNAIYPISKNIDATSMYFEAISYEATKIADSEMLAAEILGNVFPGRPYFKGKRLIEIVALKQAIEKLDAPNSESNLLARVGLASVGVPSSEMKRQTDLRYRTLKEPQDPNLSPFELFAEKTRQMIEDISNYSVPNARCQLTADSAITQNNISNEIDFILTSPPYLNGTNYFRNTKIELWLSGHINHENELIGLNQQAMIAGINNVNKSSRKGASFDFVDAVASRIEPVTYDRRIPELVRGYAADTDLWIKNCSKMLRSGGRLVVDIGDSKFAGVHVPTDNFIKRISEMNGLHLVESQIVRQRRSKDGSPLTQFLLVFEK